MSVLPGASNILLALLACSMPSILPAMSLHEVLEVKRNYSVKGLLPTDRHHLAPRGVLSLDELPELSTQTLEVLR